MGVPHLATRLRLPRAVMRALPLRPAATSKLAEAMAA